MPWPWPPIHREHRVFDRMSDEDAAREVTRMLRARRGRIVSESAVFGVCIGLMICFGGGLLAAVIAGSTRGPDGWLLLFPVVAFSLIAGYLSGVWQHAVLSSAALHACLNSAAKADQICYSCLYPLGGLPVDSGRIICPECGTSTLKGKSPVAQPPNPSAAP